MDKHDAFEVAVGASFDPDPGTAVAELARRIYRPAAALVVVFCSTRYDLEALGREIAARFAGQPVIGCTTAGELLGDRGYCEGGIVGASLVSRDIVAHPRLLTGLRNFSFASAGTMVRAMEAGLAHAGGLDPARQFGLLLVDGLSLREEEVAAALQGCLKGVQMVGGSAGAANYDMPTAVYFDGKFHTDGALFTLVECGLPFHLFRFQHFVPTERKLVITDADPVTRTVFGMNGAPAVEAYADAAGVAPAALDECVFAANPVMVGIGGEWYVRSIQRANPDGSLTFYCAIESGLVLTLGRGVDLVGNIRNSLSTLRAELPGLRFVLTFDCILRRLELVRNGTIQAASEAWRDVALLGLSTYGEQFNGLHVNQTLTGLAIGDAASVARRQP